jgi:hypothetical protein
MQLGTAEIKFGRVGGYARELWAVNYMTAGSFLRGEQLFLSEKEAKEFCAERRLRVV